MYFPNPQFELRATLSLRKVHSRRITAAEWHPEGRHFVTGDKAGNVKVWYVGDVAYGGGALDEMDGRVGMSYLHHCNINNICFDGRERDFMYTSSSDGIITRTRISLMGSVEEQRQLDECAPSREVVLDMNLEWRGDRRSYVMAYGLAYDDTRGCLYIGGSNGVMWRRDPREAARAETVGRFHKDKVSCVDVNKRGSDLLATASNDRKVCLWDARKFAPGHELGYYEHGRTVSSAYFSPNTGGRLLTTAMDNRIRVWSDVYGFVGCVNEREDEAGPLEIVHSHDFHRYLNPFRAVWDPKDWKDDLFMCGRFLGDAYHWEDWGGRKEAVLLHPIDLFSVKGGGCVASLVDSVTELICTTNRFHPLGDLILTAASANVVMWTKPEKEGEKEAGRYRRRGDNGGNASDSDGNDDDNTHGGGGDWGPRKKQKISAVVARRSSRSNRNR